MRNENVPTPSGPERPPLAPHDHPDPAPQAAAWQRALRVIGCSPPGRDPRVVKTSVTKTVRRIP
jgi:hypothetical protein